MRQTLSRSPQACKKPTSELSSKPRASRAMLLSAVAVLLILLGSADVFAASVWNGSVNNNWDVANNWTPSGIPNGTTDVQINGAATIALNTTGQACKTLTIGTTAAVTISGSGLTLDIYSGDYTHNQTSGTVTISCNLILGDPVGGTYTGNWTEGSGAVTNITGSISETGGARFINKLGTGNMNLGAAGKSASYTGATNIQNGKFTLQAVANYLPTGTSLVLGSATPTNGTLDINGNNQTVSSISILGSGGVNNIITNSSATPATFTVNTSGTPSFAGKITGTTALTKDGTGTLTLTAVTGSSNYSGATTVANGTLKLGAASTLPVGTSLVLGSGANNGVLDLAGFAQTVVSIVTSGTGTTNAVDNSAGTAATFTVNNAGAVTYNGLIKGTNTALAKTAAGTLTLGGNNTYTGNTTISAGTLSISSDNNLGASPTTVSIAASAILQATNDVTTSRTISLTGSTATIDVATNKTLTVNTGLTGNFNFAKTSAGTLVLKAASTRSSGTNTFDGWVRIEDGQALNTANTATTLNGGTPGATLEIAIPVGTTNKTVPNALTLGNNTTILASTTSTISNNVTIGASASVTIKHNGTPATESLTVTTAGLLTGPNTSTIHYNGTGRVVIGNGSGSNNTNADISMSSNSAILQLGNINSLGSTGSTGTMTVTTGTLAFGVTGVARNFSLAGGVLSCTGGDFTCSSGINVTGAAAISLDDPVSPGTPRGLTLSGVISNSNNINVTAPSGSSKLLVLSNTGNTYKGQITVNSNVILQAFAPGTLGVANPNQATVNLSGGQLQLRSIGTNGNADFNANLLLSSDSSIVLDSTGDSQVNTLSLFAFTLNGGTLTLQESSSTTHYLFSFKGAGTLSASSSINNKLYDFSALAPRPMTISTAIGPAANVNLTLAGYFISAATHTFTGNLIVDNTSIFDPNFGINRTISGKCIFQSGTGLAGGVTVNTGCYALFDNDEGVPSGSVQETDAINFNVITGIGTHFTSEFAVGDLITMTVRDPSTNTYIDQSRIVSSIQSDTTLHVSVGFLDNVPDSSQASTVSVGYSRMRPTGGTKVAGFVNATNGSTTVTGNGSTTFLTSFAPGDYIVVENQFDTPLSTEIRTVASIADNNTLTVTSAFSYTSNSNSANAYRFGGTSLSGTVAVTAGSKNVVGTGSTFTAAMVGDVIAVNVGNGALEYRTIATFTDATHVTVNTAFNTTTASGNFFRYANGSRIGDSATVSLNGGTLEMLTRKNVTHIEQIGTLAIGTGQNTILISANSTQAGQGDAQIVAGTFTHNPGAFLNFVRNTSGTETSNLYLSNLADQTMMPYAMVFDAPSTSGSPAWYRYIAVPTPTGEGVIPVTSSFATVKDGRWGDGTTWSTGTVPTATDSVIVRHTVTLQDTTNAAQSYSVNFLTFDSSAVNAQITGASNVSLSITSGGIYVTSSALSPRIDANVNFGNPYSYVATPGTTTSFNAPLLALSGNLVGKTLTMTSGLAAGEFKTITAFTASTGAITVGAAFSVAPAAGDTFSLDAVDVEGSVNEQNSGSGQKLIITGTLGGSAGMTKFGPGGLLLSGLNAGNNSYSGTTSLVDGALYIGSDSALGTGTLAISSTTGSTTTLVAYSAARTLPNNVTILSDFTLGDDSDLTLNGSATLGNSAKISITGSHNFIINGAITESGSSRAIELSTANGTLRLSGNNLFSGGVTLTSGTLQVGHNSGLGTGALGIPSGTLAGRLISAYGGARILNNTVSVVGPFTINGTNDLKFAGPITLVSTVQIDIPNLGQTEFGGVISGGANRLTKTGAGVLLISSDNSAAWSGGMDFNNGTLLIGNDKAIGTGSLATGGVAGATVTVQAYGAARSLSNALTMNFSFTISGTNDLTFSGTAKLATGLDITLTDLSSGITTFSGTLSGLNANDISDTFTKSGTGVVVFQNAISSGAKFVINAGTVRLNSGATNGVINLPAGRSGTLTTTGTTSVTVNGGSGTTGLYPNDGVIAGGQYRNVVSITDSSHFVTDSAFSPNLTNSAWQVAHPVTVKSGATFDVDNQTGAASNARITNRPIVLSGGTLNLKGNTSTNAVVNQPCGTITLTSGTASTINVTSPGSAAATTQLTANSPGIAVNAGSFLSFYGNPSGTPFARLVLTGQGDQPALSWATINAGRAAYDSTGGKGIIPVTASTVFTIAPGNWNNTATWNAATLPVAGDNVIIRDAVTLNVDATVATVTFDNQGNNAGALTGASNTLTIGSGGIYVTDGLTRTINSNINFNNQSAVISTGNGSTLNINTTQTSSVVSNANGITKIGAGQLVLDGTNSFSNGVTVLAGTLSARTDGNLGAGAGGIILGGGTFGAVGTFTSSRTFTLTNDSTIDIGNGFALTLTSALPSGTNSNAVTKTGAGTLVLSPAADNLNSTGARIINGGTIKVTTANALGANTAPVTVSNGALEIGNSNTTSLTVGYDVLMKDGSTLRSAVNSPGIASTSGVITIDWNASTILNAPGTTILRVANPLDNKLAGGGGTANIKVTGGGRVILFAATTFVGTWKIPGASDPEGAQTVVLEADSTTSLGGVSNLMVVNSGTFAKQFGLTMPNPITLGGGTLGVINASCDYTGSINVTAPSFISLVNVNNSGAPASFTVSGVISASMTNASITNVALTSNVATITTAAAHNFVPGVLVNVSINVPSTDPTYALNGGYVIASVPTPTTFTYAKSTGDIASTPETGSASASALTIPATANPGTLTVRGSNTITEPLTINSGTVLLNGPGCYWGDINIGNGDASKPAAMLSIDEFNVGANIDRLGDAGNTHVATLTFNRGTLFYQAAQNVTHIEEVGAMTFAGGANTVKLYPASNVVGLGDLQLSTALLQRAKGSGATVDFLRSISSTERANWFVTTGYADDDSVSFVTTTEPPSGPSPSVYKTADGIIAQPILRVPENPPGLVNGINYAHYLASVNNLPDFNTLTPVETGTRGYPTTYNNPSYFAISPRQRDDQFLFKFTGYIYAQYDGFYTFTTYSDDGSQLFIGSQLVVDNDGLHGTSPKSGVIALKAGKHAITVTFFEQGGGEYLDVRWSLQALNPANSFGEQLVPNGNLYIVPPAATPTYIGGPPPGNSTTFQTVNYPVWINDATPGAEIFYTTDGSTPTINSTPYFALAAGTITTTGTSATVTQPITVVQRDTILAAGVYRTVMSVTDSTHFTLDAAFTPDLSGASYEIGRAIPISASTTFKAIAVASGLNISPVGIGTFIKTNVPPRVTNVIASGLGGTGVDVFFDRPVQAGTGANGAENVNNYFVDGAHPSAAVASPDRQYVRLTVAALTAGVDHNLQAINIQENPQYISYKIPKYTIGSQNYGGTLGLDFDVVTPITVKQLGCFDHNSDGLQSPINVYIFDRTNTAAPLATANFATGTGDTLIEGSRFKAIADLQLPAGFQGSIVADGYSSTEMNGNRGVSDALSNGWFAATMDSGGGQINFVGSGRFGNAGQFPTNLDGNVQRYMAGTFMFQSQAAGTQTMADATAAPFTVFRYYPMGDSTDGNNGTSTAITREKYKGLNGQGIGGTQIVNLTSDPSFPNFPSLRDLMKNFESPSNIDDNYGTRMRGFFYPQAADNNTYFDLWIATDDDGSLFISSDDNPNNKMLTAYINGWTASRNWIGGSAKFTTRHRLQSGQRYYVEALQKEGGGGDNLAALLVTNGTTVNSGDLPTIGKFLSPIMDSTTTSPPKLLSVVAAGPNNKIIATFDKPLDNTTATDPLKYLIVGGSVTVQGGGSSPTLDASKTVVTLTTSAMTAGTQYTLIVDGVKETNGASITVPLTGTVSTTSGSIAVGGSGTVFANELGNGNYIKSAATEYRQVAYVTSNTSLNVKASTTFGSNSSGQAYRVGGMDFQFFATGTVSLERWDGIGGGAVANLTSAATFPNKPSWGGEPVNASSDNLKDNNVIITNGSGQTNPTNIDNFGYRMRGYYIPNAGGTHYFWIASDDNSELWVSLTNDTSNPVNKQRVAQVNAWTSHFEWNKEGGATISNVALTSNVVTITTSAAHNFLTGMQVTVNATTNTAVNGPFVITSVPSTTTFTYALTHADIASSADTGSVNITGVDVTPYFVDDAVPPGATAASDGGDNWTWVTSNPAPFSGTQAHQSNIGSGEHQHYFYSANPAMILPASCNLFTYVYLDPANPPSEVMVQWNDGSWEHRAYWGDNSIGWGTDNSTARHYMGPLPPTGQWVRLEVSSASVGLNSANRAINGIAFTLFGGRATWDATGYQPMGQRSVAVNLTAGQKYYFEALQKEGGGGDNLAVAVTTTSTYPNTTGLAAPINSDTVAPYIIAPQILTSPTNQSVSAGATVSFSVSATGTYTSLPTSPSQRFTWYQSNGGAPTALVNGGTNPTVSGATTDTLTLTNVPIGYDGYTYYCVVQNLAGSAQSATALLRVYPVPVIEFSRMGNVTNSGTDGTAPGSSTYAEITTAAAHNLAVGQTVTVTLNTNKTLSGTFVVTAVPTATTLRYALVVTAIAPSADTGTVCLTGIAQAEGDTGSHVYNVVVTCNPAPTRLVTVNYAVTAGTATFGDVDYTTILPGTLYFSPGVTSQIVPITIFGDVLNEDDETIVLSLSSPVNANLGIASQFTYTITNDDNKPTVQFAVDHTDANEMFTSVNISVTLSAASGKTVIVSYADLHTGNAINFEPNHPAIFDFTMADDDLVFVPGQTTKFIGLTVVNDLNFAETLPYETANLQLSNPVNADPGVQMTHQLRIYDPPRWGVTGAHVWSSTGSWNPTVVPVAGSGTGIIFPALGAQYTANNDIAGTYILNRIQFGDTVSANSNVISGNAIQFQGTGASILQTGSAAYSISTPLDFSVNTAFDGLGTGIVTISSPITGSGILNKKNTSTYALTNSSINYTGNTTVTGGTLIIDGTLVSQASIVSVASGATLRGIGTIARNVTNAGVIAPGNTIGRQGTKGVLTLQKVDFSNSGQLTVRATAPSAGGTVATDTLIVNAPGPFGNSSVLNINLDIPDGTYTPQERTIFDYVPSGAGDYNWVDDQSNTPGGGTATFAGDGGDTWTWVNAGSGAPPGFNGANCHVSSNAGGGGEHQHYFYSASTLLTLAASDKLFAYVYVDNNVREIMLQWNNGSWEHRAIWGTNEIGWGADNTAARFHMGAIPARNQWIRLEVDPNDVGLVGTSCNGMAFTLAGGQAWWDRAGKGPPPMIPGLTFGSVNWSPGGATSPSPNITLKYYDNAPTPNLVGTSASPPGPNTPWKTLKLAVGGAVTPVTLDSFTARSDGSGVLLDWNCVSEFENLGFNVYRREAGGENDWTKINKSLIPGRITSAEAKTYRYYDFAKPGEYEYRLEDVSTRRETKFYGKLAGPVHVDGEVAEDSEITLDALTTAIDGALAEVQTQRNDTLGALFDKTLAQAKMQLIPGQPEPKDARAHAERARAQSVLQPPVVNLVQRAATVPQVAGAGTRAAGTRSAGAGVRSVTAQSGQVAKVVYSGSGVLFIQQTSLPAGFDATHVTITRGGQPVQALSATVDGLLLYAPGYADEYTDKDVFFLAPSVDPTATAATVGSTITDLFTATATNTSAATVNNQYTDIYFDWDLAPQDYTPWFSNKYLTTGTTQTFTLNLPDASSNAGSISVDLWSFSANASGAPDHELQIFINGTPVGSTIWAGGQAVTLTMQVPAGVFANGSNTIDLRTPSTWSNQISLVHSISADYTKTLNGPLTSVSTQAQQVYEISGMPPGPLYIVQVPDSGAPALVDYQEQAVQGVPYTTYTVRFQTSGTGTVLALPSGSAMQAQSIQLRTMQPLDGTAKYLAVGPSQFTSEIQPLITARNLDGLNAKFVDQEAIFDYYGYGRYGPEAIRTAVRETHPQYLMLVGRTTYNYRNYNGTNVDPLCPSFLVKTTYFWQTVSDAAFGDLGKGYSEVSVGRFPANTPSDLAGMVTRTLAYKGLSASGWHATIVADKVDPNVANFPAEANSIAASAPDITWDKQYLGVNYATTPDLTAAMKQAASGGTDLMVFVGHGNSQLLGLEDPHILDTTSVQNWTGNVVFLQTTCNGNYFATDIQNRRSIASQGMIQPQGGIAASISTSTFMLPDPAAEFMQVLIQQASTPDATLRWGDAVRLAQQWAAQKAGAGLPGFYGDLAKTESILGDPALPIYAANAFTTPPGPVTGVNPAPPGTGGVIDHPVDRVLKVDHIRGKLAFNKPGHDGVAIFGEITGLPKVIAGSAVSVDVGGATASFTLDAHNSGRSGLNSIRLAATRKNGVRGFRIMLNGDLAAAWADEGLTNTTTSNTAATLTTTINIDGATYQTSTTVHYSAKAGKLGRFK